MKDKEMKIEFAPGCFDHFEGSQEELDELVNQIKSIFEGKSIEEIQSMSVQLTEDDIEEMSEEEQERLLASFMDDKTRKLQ